MLKIIDDDASQQQNSFRKYLTKVLNTRIRVVLFFHLTFMSISRNILLFLCKKKKKQLTYEQFFRQRGSNFRSQNIF